MWPPRKWLKFKRQLLDWTELAYEFERRPATETFDVPWMKFMSRAQKQESRPVA